MPDRGVVPEHSDEDLLVAVAAGPGALPEFYRRHVANVMGTGVRRFGNPEDVADFVATVFLEVLRSAGGFDPRRGSAVSWLYGLAGNVAAGMCRQQARQVDAEQRLAGQMLLDADDDARVEERIDAAATRRRVYEAMQQLGEADRRLLELVAVDGLSPGEAAHTLKITPIAARSGTRPGRPRRRHPVPQRRGHRRTGRQQHQRMCAHRPRRPRPGTRSGAPSSPPPSYTGPPVGFVTGDNTVTVRSSEYPPGGGVLVVVQLRERPAGPWAAVLYWAYADVNQIPSCVDVTNPGTD